MVTNHSSLSAIAVVPPVLRPQPKMAPNEPCWCLSKKKWKKCHKLREYEKEITWDEFQARSETLFKTGVCLHPASPVGCTPKIISAHTVQKGGGLKYIADNNHVLSLKMKSSDFKPRKGRSFASRRTRPSSTLRP